MFYTLAGPVPAAPELLAAEIARRTGMCDLPPQIESLEAPAGGLTGGDGYVVAGREFVEALRRVEPNAVALAVGDAYLLTSVQEMGRTMIRGRDLVEVPHGIFRVPEWGQRTYFAGATAEFVRGYAKLEQAGQLVPPRRWRRRA